MLITRNGFLYFGSCYLLGSNYRIFFFSRFNRHFVFGSALAKITFIICAFVEFVISVVVVCSVTVVLSVTSLSRTVVAHPSKHTENKIVANNKHKYLFITKPSRFDFTITLVKFAGGCNYAISKFVNCFLTFIPSSRHNVFYE